MSSPFDRSAGAVIQFSSVRARDWGVNCQAYDLIEVPGRRFTYEHMPSGESEVTHLHDRAHQVFHVLSGTLMVEVNDEVLVANERDTIEVPAGTPHRAWTGQDQGATFILFSTPSTVGDRRGVGVTGPHSPQVRRAGENDIAELIRLRRLMFDEMGLDTTNRNWETAAHDIIVRELARHGFGARGGSPEMRRIRRIATHG